MSFLLLRDEMGRGDRKAVVGGGEGGAHRSNCLFRCSGVAVLALQGICDRMLREAGKRKTKKTISSGRCFTGGEQRNCPKKGRRKGRGAETHNLEKNRTIIFRGESTPLGRYKAFERGC